jgi:GDP-L-fucose synthase
MQPQSRIYVAGGKTFIGSAIVRELRRDGYRQVMACDPMLTDRVDVDAFFARCRPEYVFVAAGMILGIDGNQRRPADLMVDNLLVSTHVIAAAHRWSADKVVYLASGCAYPRDAPQPMTPDAFMTGPLERTSEFYASAKLAGMKLCEAYRRQHGARFVTAVPANPYGIGDDLDPADAHVIGGLMFKMHDARERLAPSIDIWGSGSPERDFIYVDDLARAAIAVMKGYEGDAPINLTAGTRVSIGDVARMIAKVVGYTGELRFDRSRPDGAAIKVLDPAPLAALGWSPTVPLPEGLARMYEWFLSTAEVNSQA